MQREIKAKTLNVSLSNGELLPIRLYREKRKTLKLSLSPTGEAVVQAPKQLPERQIADFVREKEGWLDLQFKKLSSAILIEPFDARQKKEAAAFLRLEAEAFCSALPEAVFAPRPKKIQIRAQKTRWASCSSLGTLSLNVYLRVLPAELRRYVYIHELCHLKHMNHSGAFWSEVARLCPDYRELRKRLKDYRLPL